MFRLFGLLLVGLVLAGCQTSSEMVQSGKIELGMTLKQFDRVMYWNADTSDDPRYTENGGSGWYNKFEGYNIIYGGVSSQAFIFDKNDFLVKITGSAEEAQQPKQPHQPTPNPTHLHQLNCWLPSVRLKSWSNS